MKEYIRFYQSIILSNHWSICFYKDSNFRIGHRENDKPSVIDSYGTFKYEVNGEFHRENDKPAVIYRKGQKSWYKYGTFMKMV